MPSNREAVIQISASIAKLRDELAKTKDELRKQESHLDRLLSGEASSVLGRDGFVTGAPPIENGDKSLNQRIIDLLDSAPNQQFNADDIAAYFPDGNITSIRSGLARLADQNRIRRVGRGQYQNGDATTANNAPET